MARCIRKADWRIYVFVLHKSLPKNIMVQRTPVASAYKRRFRCSDGLFSPPSEPQVSVECVELYNTCVVRGKKPPLSVPNVHAGRSHLVGLESRGTWIAEPVVSRQSIG